MDPIFTIDTDTQPTFLVEDIKKILNKNFNLDIILLRESDGFEEYKIIQLE